jgi:hypothetical protein
MVWISVGSLIDKGQPWVGTRYLLAGPRQMAPIVGPDRKAIRDQNGQPIYQLVAGEQAATVKFLGMSPDGNRIIYQDENTGQQNNIPLRGSGYFVQRLTGGRRRTRRARRRTHRKH